MSRTVIITEAQRNELISRFILEDTTMRIEKALAVKKFLDDNFKRADISEIDDSGYANAKPIVVYLDQYKQPIKNLTDEDLLDMLLDKFKNIMPDEKEKRQFLLDVMRAWYKKDRKLDLGLI